ncbi:MAG: DUF4347 domain-containing protein [Planctomycetota bacterium]
MRTILNTALALIILCGSTLAQITGGGAGYSFERGDGNGDGSINIGDAIGGLSYLFSGAPVNCLDAYDFNDDGVVNLADPISVLSFLFAAGAPPAPPYGACGGDPTADGIGCDGPTTCGPVSTGPPLMSGMEFFGMAPQFTGFAVQMYDPITGAPLPLNWIEDFGLVQAFVQAIQPMSFQPGGLTHDLTASTYVRTFDGQVFTFDLVDIKLGQPGRALFADGVFLTAPYLQDIIGDAYGMPDYDSTREKEKEAECGSGDTPCTTWEEEALIDDPVGVCVWTDVTLIVYEDDPGKTWNKDYADAQVAADASIATVKADGQNSIVNKMRSLAAEWKKVKCLVFAVHGGPGSIRIGPKGTPFKSETRVGQHDGQRTATEFGEAIAPYLAADAQITLLSCQPAKDGGTAETDGPEFIQDLADASGATVVASDANVRIDGGTASTTGNVHTATPGGGAGSPSITDAAPAGDIPACP